MVRHPFAGLGMDGGGHGGDVGARPAYHRTVGVGLWRGRPQGIDFRADWGFPPALEPAQQEELKEAVQQLPTTWGMELANWNWKVVGQFVWERYGISISRSGCLKWLHRLGFAYKRPKKRLLKADAGKRTDFVAEYAALREECQETGARIYVRYGIESRRKPSRRAA